MIRNAVLFAAPLALLASQSAQALEVRTCDGPLRTAPLSDERGVQSALLQAYAVVNDSKASVAVNGIKFHLKSAGKVADTRVLSEAQIARAAKLGPVIVGIGQAIPSQLCNGSLLAGTRPATSPTLAPGEAIVFLHELFVWQGQRDALEIMALTGAVESTNKPASLAIVSSTAVTKALFPIAGRSFVPVAASLHTPHRWLTIEEFGLDIVALGPDGGTHRGTGDRLSDYYAFGRRIRAVAVGKVVAAAGSTPDNAAMLKHPKESDESYLARLLAGQDKLIAAGIEAVLGNHVVIDHGNGEFSVYAHLQQGSLTVRAGEMVSAGQTLAKLGSSGNSTEPHLHFQICDNADMVRCRTLPVQFDGVKLPLELGHRTIQSGDIVETER